ncbi:MAG: replicative DNA helicase [Kofleriaceae bacterium]
MTKSKLPIPVEQENSVIGGILLKPDVLAQIDWLEASHFGYIPAAHAFGAIRDLEAAGTPIDVVTVEAQMQRRGLTDPVKGYHYLGECSLRVPTADNVIEYAKLIRDAALNRQLRLALDRVLSSDEQSGAELLSMALGAVSKLDGELPDDASTIDEVVRRRFQALEEIAEQRARGARTMTGFPTGVSELDRLIGGWQSKIVTVVAARPGMGKSSLGLATADACSEAGFGVHLFSLEDSEDAYADRTMSRLSHVPAEAMRNASLDRTQLRSIASAWPKVTKRNWIIDGRSGITADEIVRSVRKHKKQNQTRVVIVDYVQLVRRPKGLSPHEALTEIVTTLADAAKHDDLAYVVMSQLNRGVESRTDKRPMMSDLRESGSLEDRAKCVVAIYRGVYYSTSPVEGKDYADGQPRHSDDEFERQVQFLLLKNNNG